jgi:hypothetical protein
LLSAPVDIAAYGWKNVNFAAATQDELTDYQGVPNARNNKLWDDSFNICRYYHPNRIVIAAKVSLVGISKITMEEARPLKNRTVPMDDEGNYIVTLDVFHQLHCLVHLSLISKDAEYFLLTDSASEQNASKDILEHHELR